MADRRGTVRVRVTALATVAVAGVLVAAGALLVVRQRTDLVEQLDDGLAATADQLTPGLAGGGSVSPSVDEDRLITVVDGSGTLLVGPALATDGAPTADDGHAIDVDGMAFHAVTRRYADPTGGEGVVQVAGSMDDIDESVRALLGSLAWIIPLATTLLAVVVWFVVGRTLRPVERIRAEVAGIGMADLGRRVPVPAGDDEIARLAVTMNDMLDRLDRSARRQRQFVADAAHELRTPLARMRAELEVDHRQPATADAAATRQSQLEEVTALQQLTDDLLTLARNDDGAPAARVARVDLDDLVLEELGAFGPSPITVDSHRVSAAQVRGDRDDLRRIVRNLLDNASRHARTAVAVELSEDDDHATLVVDDDGPGIPVERRQEIFERFARLDDARTTGAGGSGLGLAIVHDLVVSHGGTVDVGTSPPGGARFTVTLPR